MATDYEREFQRHAQACGEPFPEVVAFFEALPAGQRVLDLGCGQGRDALMAARLGHRVHGVELAPTGIRQLQERARAEGLAIEAEVGDIERFEPEGPYDVVLLDRVLHMLPTEDRRRTMLARLQAWVAVGGRVLIADTRRNRELIREAFEPERWLRELDRGDLLCVRRREVPAA